MGYVYVVPDAIIRSPDREALARLVERIKADGSRVRVGRLWDCATGLPGQSAALFPRVRLTISDPPKARHPPCGARTRRGTPCRARCVPFRNRCRMHGGLSTGPTCAEGRARIAAANRRRAGRRTGSASRK